MDTTTPKMSSVNTSQQVTMRNSVLSPSSNKVEEPKKKQAV